MEEEARGGGGSKFGCRREVERREAHQGPIARENGRAAMLIAGIPNYNDASRCCARTEPGYGPLGHRRQRSEENSCIIPDDQQSVFNYLQGHAHLSGATPTYAEPRPPEQSHAQGLSHTSHLLSCNQMVEESRFISFPQVFVQASV